MKTLAITGICKNAGKTTVMNYLLSKSIGVNAITSIGLDGEITDNVFETRKPRIFVTKGTYIISAKSSFSRCDITYEVVATTSINTSLGYICVVKALSDGYVLIAGPNKVSELNEVRALVSNYGASTLYIDGAINRKQFSSLKFVDEVHMVIGACFNQDMNKTMEEAALIKALFSVKKYHRYFDSSVTLIVDDCCYNNPIIDLSFLKEVVSEKNNVIYVNSALNSAMLKYLMILGTNIDVVVEDANKLFLNLNDFKLLEKSRVNLYVCNTISLTDIYVNPQGRGYTYDTNEFKKQISEIFGCNAIDVGGAYSEL